MSKTNTKMIAACVACLALHIPSALADTSASFTVDNTSFLHLRSTSTNFQLNGGLNRIEELASSSFLIVPETEEASSSSASSAAASSSQTQEGGAGNGGTRGHQIPPPIRPPSGGGQSSSRSQSSQRSYASSSTPASSASSAASSITPTPPPLGTEEVSRPTIATNTYTIDIGWIGRFRYDGTPQDWLWVAEIKDSETLHGAAPGTTIIDLRVPAFIFSIILIVIEAILLSCAYWVFTFETFELSFRKLQKRPWRFFGLLFERKKEGGKKRAKKKRRLTRKVLP